MLWPALPNRAPRYNDHGCGAGIDVAAPALSVPSRDWLAKPGPIHRARVDRDRPFRASPTITCATSCQSVGDPSPYGEVTATPKRMAVPPDLAAFHAQAGDRIDDDILEAHQRSGNTFFVTLDRPQLRRAHALGIAALTPAELLQRFPDRRGSP
jgi:hypothetical protein